MSATTRPAWVSVSRADRPEVPQQSPAPPHTEGATAQAMTPDPALGATARRSPLTAPPRSLTVVTSPGLHVLGPARTPFVGLVVMLIVAGLMALLTLNTALQQASFTVSRLERQAAALVNREQALAQQVAVEEGPQRLAERAASLGMVPSGTPAFIRTADGTVLGVPTPATQPVGVAVAIPVPAPAPPAAPPEADAAPELPVPDLPLPVAPDASLPMPDALVPGAEVPGAAPSLPVPEAPPPVPEAPLPVPEAPLPVSPAPATPGTAEVPGVVPGPGAAPAVDQPPVVGLDPVEATTP